MTAVGIVPIMSLPVNCVLLCYITLTCVQTAPLFRGGVNDPPSRRASEVLNLNHSTILHTLSSLGYLLTPSGSRIEDLLDEDVALTRAVSLYQRVWNLSRTGVMDVETMNHMTADRCGNPDDALIMQVQGLRRGKRYVAVDPWYNVHLTYMITAYSVKSDLTRQQTDDSLSIALKMWADVSYLSFNLEPVNPDIVIRFATRSHGDNNPFDGRCCVLAHAFSKSTGFPGQLHVDDDEPWRFMKPEGVEITNTLVHELGHVFGLHHTNSTDSIMYPQYIYREKLRLSEDDILGIQSLYGNAVVNVTAENPIEQTDWCNLTTFIDAALYIFDTDYRIYLFKGDQYMVADKNGLLDNYPVATKTKYPALGLNVDAAFVLPTTYVCMDKKTLLYFLCMLYDTYYFQGLNYILYRWDVLWEYDKISKRFPGIPTNIDSAFLREDGNIYFTKGENIWKFIRGRGVSRDSPKRINDTFKGLPPRFDAAFLYAFKVNGQTHYYNFFFAGPNYYAIYGLQNEVTSNLTEPFPRSISTWWLGCADKQQNSSSKSADLSPPQVKRLKKTFYAEMREYTHTLPEPKQAFDISNTLVDVQLSNIQTVVNASLVAVTRRLPRDNLPTTTATTTANSKSSKAYLSTSTSTTSTSTTAANSNSNKAYLSTSTTAANSNSRKEYSSISNSTTTNIGNLDYNTTANSNSSKEYSSTSNSTTTNIGNLDYNTESNVDCTHKKPKCVLIIALMCLCFN